MSYQADGITQILMRQQYKVWEKREDDICVTFNPALTIRGSVPPTCKILNNSETAEWFAAIFCILLIYQYTFRENVRMTTGGLLSYIDLVMSP